MRAPGRIECTTFWYENIEILIRISRVRVRHHAWTWTFLQEKKDQVEFGNDLDEVLQKHPSITMKRLLVKSQKNCLCLSHWRLDMHTTSLKGKQESRTMLTLIPTPTT